MQKWDAALNSNLLFTEESKALLWNDNKLNNGKSTGYGFGGETKKRKNNLIVSHDGITGTEMIKFLDESITIVVLTNLGHGSFYRVNSWGLAGKVAKMLGYKY